MSAEAVEVGTETAPIRAASVLGRSTLATAGFTLIIVLLCLVPFILVFTCNGFT